MSAVYKGAADARFAAVRDAFAQNLTEGLDQGAAFAVVADGRVVVDLWGGYADAMGERPWARETLVNIWSTTKGVAALAIAMLVDQGVLDYEAPVARVWPEFAAGGKAEVSLGCLLSHQAGLPGCLEPITVEDLLAWRPFVDRLAALAPLWPPGEDCAYHAVSFGHLAGEVLRRADGRSIGAFVAEEIARPFGAEIYIGLPASEDARAAEIIVGPGSDDDLIEAEYQPFARLGYLNPRIDPGAPNCRAWRAAEVPAANGQADALSLARLYGALASDGMVDGKRLLRPQTIAAATAERYRGFELAFGWPIAFGAGFMLNEVEEFGPGPRAFGHSGWGGSYAFADPDAGIGVAYVMNQMLGFGNDYDPRQLRLLGALYDAL